MMSKLKKINGGQMKKKKLKKRKSNAVPVILVGCIIIFLTFTFALSQLTTPTQETQAQPDNPEVTRQAFIDRLVPHAKELQKQYGVLSSITLGQAILESNWGKSELASKYHNLFGIKAFGSQNKVTLSTKEYKNKQWVTIQGEFKVYESDEASMDDHALLFVNGVSWDKNKYQSVIRAKDYKIAAYALQQAGYATDPTYAEKIIQVIEAHNLQQYDA